MPYVFKCQTISNFYFLKVEEMMSDIIKAFKDNAETETWLSEKSRNAVEHKVRAA
jgi:hypothetical protein